MATSVYFNNFNPSVINEQRLLEDLIVESIQIMGHDVFYIPRDSYNGIDEIWGESINAKFTRAYSIDAYLANVEGYEGDGDFFSKFGLDIRDTTNIILSNRAFTRFIPSTIAGRPREGDLIYVPLMKKLFEIKFVEEELLFFSLGKRNPYIYELRCELFRYSSESLTTGVEEIDVIEAESSYSVKLHVEPGLETFYNNEIVYQGANLASAFAKAEVKSFDLLNRNIEVFNIVGEFVANTVVTGVTSNTSSVVVYTDALGNTTYYDMSDNRPIEDDADVVIVVNENNPLGNP
jgi:hypothetical protein